LKRVKRRYLSLQLDSDGLPSGKEVIGAVWLAVTRLYGEHGASQTSLALIDYNLEKKTAVLRTNLTTLNEVRVSLATITSIAGKESAVHVTAISGTIKALLQKTKQPQTTKKKQQTRSKR
jgi:RNase P/RNase MRP subunit POP5